jgi:hypothetical protein
LTECHTVLVEVFTSVQGVQKARIELEATTAMALRQSGLFRRVVTRRASPSATTNLRLAVRILELKRVTAESRMLYGVLALHADITAQDALVDAATGVVLGRFTVEGRSSSLGTTEQAVTRAAQQIVEFISTEFRNAGRLPAAQREPCPCLRGD